MVDEVPHAGNGGSARNQETSFRRSANVALSDVQTSSASTPRTPTDSVSIVSKASSAPPDHLDLGPFDPLINALNELKESGDTVPIRSVVVAKMGSDLSQIYRRVGVDKFKAYANLAASRGIVVNKGDRIALAGN